MTEWIKNKYKVVVDGKTIMTKKKKKKEEKEEKEPEEKKGWIRHKYDKKRPQGGWKD